MQATYVWRSECVNTKTYKKSQFTDKIGSCLNDTQYRDKNCWQLQDKLYRNALICAGCSPHRCPISVIRISSIVLKQRLAMCLSTPLCHLIFSEQVDVTVVPPHLSLFTCQFRKYPITQLHIEN